MVDRFIEGMTYVSLERVSPHREKGDVILALKNSHSNMIRYKGRSGKVVNSIKKEQWAHYEPVLKRI